MSFLNLEGIFYAIYVALRDADYDDLLERFIDFWETLSVVSIFVALALIAGIAYTKVRVSQVEEEEEEQRLERVREEAAVAADSTKTATQRAWDQVLEHVASDNPGDWRLAIIEADILLDQLVEELGFIGETLGERLRSANRTRFQTIDAAWEAHKVRNRIAHEGAAYQVTQREARRVIDLYRQVFEEFQVIQR